MSNLAIGFALGASSKSNSGSSSSAQKKYYCNQMMPSFNPKTATVKDKQNYASCVDHLYPSMSPVDIIALKVIIIITFLIFIAGAHLGYKKDGVVLAFLAGIVASVLSFAAMILFYQGFMFVIN